jgi:hypothetical protein
VYLELGRQRVFACALDWPGWCRAGKTAEQALDTLTGYAERYAVVARAAGVAFVPAGRDNVQVVEQLAGSAGATDFGVPGAVASSDRQPWPAAVASQQLALLRAAWLVFDQVAAVTPAQLRKGPRGGGRDRDKLIDHVLAAETAYARKLGVRQRQPVRNDPGAIAELREAIVAALQAPDALRQPPGTGWPPRYAVRRIAWHVLDHAWEMEDRRLPVD